MSTQTLPTTLTDHCLLHQAHLPSRWMNVNLSLHHIHYYKLSHSEITKKATKKAENLIVYQWVDINKEKVMKDGFQDNDRR